MRDNSSELNDFLVQVFHEILRIEEDSLKTGEFKNLSVREMHVIEAVCNACEHGGQNRATDIAKALHISAGTLTSAVAQLEKKDCLIRHQDKLDKRIVRLYATEKGRRANTAHQQFHEKMVTDVMGTLEENELDCLIKGLSSLKAFFDQNKIRE